MSGVSNTSLSTRVYTSKIIKAGALLADTKTMLANWDETLSVANNLARFRRENIFGKASRSRIEDMLAIFRQRYLASAPVTKALVTLVRGGFPNEGLDRILYFHAAQADALLHDSVTETLARFHTMGKVDVVPADIRAVITKWIAEGTILERGQTVCLVCLRSGMVSNNP